MRVDSLIQGFGLIFVAVTFSIVMLHLAFADLSLYETLCKVTQPNTATFVDRDGTQIFQIRVSISLFTVSNACVIRLSTHPHPTQLPQEERSLLHPKGFVKLPRSA